MRGRWPKLLIHTIYHNTQWVKNNFKKSHNTSYISLFSNIWLIVYLAHEELHVGIGNEPNIRKKCQPCKYLVFTVFKSWSMKFVNNFCYVIYIQVSKSKNEKNDLKQLVKLKFYMTIRNHKPIKRLSSSIFSYDQAISTTFIV